MLIPSKFSGYVAGRREYHGKGSSSPPPPDPRMFDIMDKQVAQGDDLISFLKQSYADNSARMQGQDDLNSQVIKQNMDLSRAAGDRADDAYKFYTQYGRPVIQQSLNDAKNWDSQEQIEKAQADAKAGVQQGFDSAQGQNTRMLERMGVNPNSGKFGALNAQIQLQKGLGLAQASNGAADTRRMEAVGMRQQAGNLASGMPAQSMGFSGQSSQFGGSASGIGQSGINSRLAGQSAYTSGMGTAGNMYGGAASQYNNLYGTQMQGWNAQQQAGSSSAAGLGSLVGTVGGVIASNPELLAAFADGGPIKGPGTGVSDSVPAINTSNGQNIRVSNGEYVVPADVVRAKGVEYFDRLKQKYHTPAAVQRGNLRMAA